MFYDPRIGDHGLPRNPLLALVGPRPIGWISTVSPSGIPNIAPYSFFNVFSSAPAIVGFASTGRKHSMDNAAATGCFVANIVGSSLAEAMNATSAEVAAGVDEFALAGLTATPGTAVAAPRVAEAPAALECLHIRTMDLTDAAGAPANAFLVLGEVVGVHIDEAILTDGFVDVTKLQPLGRLGYMEYAVVRDSFTMARPIRPA
ncbi:MAG TPA: flavin reductase family protein [Methylomirabilota bacterium]|nr:flavin reductase family protein [Methylomirabilota bacterium]